MYKFKTRAIALLTALVLTMLLIPVGILGNFALALDDDDFEAKVTLDYNALFSEAYVINPSFTLTSGASLSFQFRGVTYTETYNAARHFTSFSNAMTYFTTQHGNNAPKVTPVFILAPGTYTTAITVPYNAIILGNNAGMDPNVKSVTAQNVANVSQMASGWAAAARKTATTLKAAVNSTRTAAESATLNNSGNGRVRVVVDGVDFNIGAHDVTNVTESATGAKHYVDLHIQNSVIKTTASKYVFRNYNAKSDVIRNGLYNVRMDGAMLTTLYDELTTAIKMDGIYFANTSTAFVGSSSPVKGNIDFELANSFLYKLSHSAPIELKTNPDYAHIAKYTFKDNLFYHIGGTNQWGIRFHTQDSDAAGTKFFPENKFEYNYYGNTFVADSNEHRTLFNGSSSSYQKSPFTINFNHNRVIGYRSMFFNITDNKHTLVTINADFNYNYYEYTDPYYGEFKGTKSLYSNAATSITYKTSSSSSTYTFQQLDAAGNPVLTDGSFVPNNHYFDHNGSPGYNEPFDYPNLRYYTDWNMTVTNTNLATFEIDSVSFYDEINYLDVNLTNKKITIGIDAGKTISNPKLTFVNKNITSEFYVSGSSSPATSFTAPASGTATAAFKAVNGSKTVAFTVTFVVDGTQQTGALFHTGYKGDIVSSTAILYAPEVAGLTKGARYKTIWDGKYYEFLVGGNAFATFEEIFDSQMFNNSDNPQIIIPAGTYGNITVTKPCTIFGYNYRYAVSSGEGINEWNYGWGWGGGQNSVVSGITIGEMPEGFTVNVSGIALKGSVTDKVRNTAGTVNLSNSIIVSDNQTIFDIDNTSVSTAANTYNLSGVRVDKVADNGVLFGAVPSTLSLDNVHLAATGLKSLFVNGWTANDVERSFTMINSRVENVTGNATLFGNLDTASNDTDSSYYVNNNVVMTDGYTGTLVKITPDLYTSATVSNNIFVNNGSDAAVMQIDYNNSNNTGALNITANRVIGFEDGYTAVNNSNITSKKYVDVSGNYFAEYSEDFETGETGVYPAGKVVCSEYYTDYNMTTLVSVTNKCDIESITSSVGTVIYNEFTEEYKLTLPEEASGATITVNTVESEATYTISGAVENIEKGQTKIFTITVTNGDQSEEYTLVVTRSVATGQAFDYNALLQKAYIIDADWSTAPATATFVFRGTTYNETFNATRHFASFNDAYAYWLSTSPDIINDTPVFLFTAGTYTSTVKVNFRGIILGANAGINPNNPAMNASTMQPNQTVSANPNWSVQNETIFTGTIYRTTRISGNTDVSLENQVVAAETAQGKDMEFYLAVDGVVFAKGSGNSVSVQDIDTGSGGKGYRNNYIYLQNFKSYNQTGTSSSNAKLLMATDTSWNHTTFHINNMRMTGGTYAVLFTKYVDNFVMDNSYIENCEGTSIIASAADIQPRHDFNYVFKNSVFVGNKYTRLINYTADSKKGDYQNGYLLFANNFLYNSVGSEWGMLRVDPNFTGLIFELSGNTIIENTDTQIKTLIEGNKAYFDFPYTLKVNNNRIAGNIGTYLPNLYQITADKLTAVDFDFNYNYFSKSYTSTSDTTGVRPNYRNAPDAGCPDPILSDDFKYYLDYNMNVLNTDLEITEIGAGTSGLSEIAIGEDDVITGTLANTTLEGMSVTFGATDATYKLYSDSECTTVVNASDYVASNRGTYTLYIRGEKNGAKGKVYTFDLTIGVGAGYFSAEFTDPHSLIQKDAFLYHPSVAGYQNGEDFVQNWNGKDYKFVVGQNAFATLDDIFANANSSSPQILMPLWVDSTVGLTINHGCEIFAPNYATSPFVKTDKNGSAVANQETWDATASYGADWYANHEYTKKELTVDSITITAGVTADVSVYGVSFKKSIYDSERTHTNSINIRFENMKKVTADTGANAYVIRVTDNASNKTATNRNTLYIKNFYIEECMSNSRIIGEHVPSETIIDGLYLSDVAAANFTNKAYISVMTDNASFTIKNSNLRNITGSDYPIRFQAYGTGTAIASGKTSVITFDNNVLYNYKGMTTSDGEWCAVYWYDNSYTGLTFTNNYLENPDAPASRMFYSANGATGVRQDGSVKITGNVFNGFKQNFVINSGSKYADDKIDLYGNYVTTTRLDYAELITTAGVQATSSNGIHGDSWWYLDSDLTRRSDEVQEMYVSGVNVMENDDINVLNAGSSSSINLNDYIVNTWGNNVTCYSDEELSIPCNLASIAIAEEGRTVYLKVGSADATDDGVTVSVNVINDNAGYTINTKYEGSTPVDETYDQMSWRGGVTYVENGNEATLSLGGFGGDGVNSFGVIYMSDCSKLEEIKAELTAGKNDISATVQSVNDKYLTQGAMVNVVTDRATSWNEKTQSYTYLYNFTVQHGYKRAVVMYAVYEDINGIKQIMFDDINIQVAGQN